MLGLEILSSKPVGWCVPFPDYWIVLVFNVIGWDMEWNFDHKSARPVQSPEKLAAQVDTLVAHGYTYQPKHLVILTHDRMFHRSPDSLALVQFIQLVKRNPNYVFETVDHYPGLKR